MKRVLAILLVLSSAILIQGQTSIGMFHNDRLKTLVIPGPPLLKEKSYSFTAFASGIWASESNDPKKALVLPMQVKLWCSKNSKVCTETSVTLGAVPTLVSIEDMDNTDYDVDKWDEHGLTASDGSLRGRRVARHLPKRTRTNWCEGNTTLTPHRATTWTRKNSDRPSQHFRFNS